MAAEARLVANGLGFTEGPVWTQDGRLLVTSISHGAVYDVSGGEPRAVARTRGGPNGMAEAADGSLYVAQNGGMYGMEDRSPEPAASGIQLVRGDDVRYLTDVPDAPNDCCFGPDGRLYFTDPRGPAQPSAWQPGRVYAMTPEGELELLAEGPAFTNGIAFDAGGARLYVAETFRQRVLVYDIEDGTLGEPREFCKTDPGFPDGVCFDEAGRLYVAATFASEVQVFDEMGRCVDRLSCGEGGLVTNCCFGGPEGQTLFVTESSGERVLAFDLEVAGLPLFPFR